MQFRHYCFCNHRMNKIKEFAWSYQRKKKINAWKFFSWKMNQKMMQTLFCVLCQNQIYQNILQIKDFGLERCLTSYQAPNTLSDHHYKAISNSSGISSVNCVPSTRPSIWDNIFHTSSKLDGSISVIVVSRQKHLF